MTSVETVSALKRKLNASIPQQAIRGVVSARLRNIGRTAKIAGFRPGKVPEKIIEQHYGAKVQQEALSEALQQSFNEAALSNNLRVAGNPQFELLTNDLYADQVEYSATFEVYPEVVMGDLSTQSVERLVYELTDADVATTITNMRKQRATYEKAARPAQNEDRVGVDFVGKLHGEVFDGGEAKDLTVVLGVGRMLPDFEEAIVGMESGQTKEFNMTFPDDYHGRHVAGKEVTFSVTLNSVDAPILPEINEAFVKEIGIADGDTGKLGEEVRKNLEREVNRRLKLHNKEAAMDALLNVAGFDVPGSLVDQEVEAVMKQAMQEMESRGVPVQEMPLHADMFRDRAEKRVKLGILLAEVVQKHELHATPDQTKAMIEDYAQNFDEAEQIIRWYAADPKRMIDVENLVLEENLVGWVMGQARTTDKTAVFSELMGNS